MSRPAFCTLFLVAIVGLSAGCSPASVPAPTVVATPPPASSAAGANAYVPTPLNPPVHVKVTDDQVTSMVAVYLAYDRGYFTDEGLDVALQISNDRSQDVQLLATSQADAIDPRVRDACRGLNVAVGAPSSQFYVDTYVSRAGMSHDDVKVVPLPGPEAIAAFGTRAIDAAWEAEPIATSLNVQGIARTVAITGELVPGAVAGALAVSPTFASDQPSATQHFVNAFLRGARDYYTVFNQSQSQAQGDRGPIIQTLTSHTTVKDTNLYSQLGPPSYDPNCSTDPTASWSVFQDFYIRRGMQERKVDISKYVDYSMINRALEAMGRVSR
jgi:ABC-type nitrate/sulfonate/bicarbonate transport system substrate-binding protein